MILRYDKVKLYILSFPEDLRSFSTISNEYFWLILEKAFSLENEMYLIHLKVKSPPYSLFWGW